MATRLIGLGFRAMEWTTQGRTVRITGAARGLGAETAAAWPRAERTWRWWGWGPTELQRVAAQCGTNAAWFECDVTDVEALERAVQGTVERFGGIDVVMANAGIATGGTIRATDPAAFERTIEINLLGVWRSVRACLPLDDVREAGAHGAPHAEQVDFDRALEGGGVGRAEVPPVAIPAFAITTSMPPKRSTVPCSGALERFDVGHVALEPGGVRAALSRHALQLVGLQPHQRHIRSARGQAAGRLTLPARAPRP